MQSADSNFGGLKEKEEMQQFFCLGALEKWDQKPPGAQIALHDGFKEKLSAEANLILKMSLFFN